MTNAYLNLAGYLFADLDELPALQQRLRRAGEHLQLRGTVLLAPEGINLFISAAPAAARQWLAQLRDEQPLQAIECKESWSNSVAFGHWRVKIKPEIVTFRQPQVRPQDGRAAAIDATTLQRWLTQGHDDDLRLVKLLDTRNSFEVEAGSFERAEHLAIKSFTDLPKALAEQKQIAKDDRVVTFCTGGIRCEKAALYMADQGYRHVLQLDGGVLNYFERVGGEHWLGELFVFDERIAIDPCLRPAAGKANESLAP